MKCHRLNLTPSEPGSLLIWTYRDVAAEHHKGAAYLHRCYLLCLFHRGARTPSTHTHTHTHTHTLTHMHNPPPPQLDTDQGHLHWVKHDSTTSHPIKRLPSAEYIRRLGMEKPGQALKYICPTCNTNCLIDVYLYRISALFDGSLEAAFGVDKGDDGKSWQQLHCEN